MRGKRRNNWSTGTMRIFITERCRSFSTRAWNAMASANLPRSSSFGIALGKLVQRLLQHRFADDEFADQVEHVVDASRVHPQNVFQHRWADSFRHCSLCRRSVTMTGTGCNGSCQSPIWLAGIRSLRHAEFYRCRRLASAAQLRLSRRPSPPAGRSDQNHTYFAGNRRNLALGRDLLLGLRAGHTNSTCLEAAGDFASGRTTST